MNFKEQNPPNEYYGGDRPELASEFSDQHEFLSRSAKKRLTPEQQEAHTRSYRRGQSRPKAWYGSSQGGGKTWSDPDAPIGHRGSAGAGKKGGPYRLNPIRGKGLYGPMVRQTLKKRAKGDGLQILREVQVGRLCIPQAARGEVPRKRSTTRRKIENRYIPASSPTSTSSLKYLGERQRGVLTP